MKYFVNETCIGCGVCVDICPDIFFMGDGGVAVARDVEVPEDLLDSAKEAQEECPSESIEKA